jgi:hypothetical protein
MTFLHFFYFLWVLVALLYPDSADENQCGSGSTTMLYCSKDPVCLLQVVAAFLAGCTEAVLTPLERIQTLLLGQNRYKPLTATSRRVMDTWSRIGVSEFSWVSRSGSGLGNRSQAGQEGPVKNKGCGSGYALFFKAGSGSALK